MIMKEPTSMDECVFFTRKTIGATGKITAWVLRGRCTQCTQGVMGKPRDTKTGKIKIRAKEYVCSKCPYTLGEEEYESSLMINMKYICPHCRKEGTTQKPYQFKKGKIDNPEKPGEKKTAKLIRFLCEHCAGNLELIKLK